MKKRKLAAVVAGLMTLSIAFSACGQAPAPTSPKPQGDLSSKVTTLIKAKDPSKTPDVAKNRKDTLVVGMEDPDGIFDLYWTSSSYSMYVTETIFDTLMDSDAEGNPIPGVAKSYDVSKDGLTYTYHLRNDVKFSDGTQLTADDVAFTATILCDPKFDGYVDITPVKLKGYDAYNSGSATSVEGIKVVDPQTIQFTIDKPDASAIYTFGTLQILSKNYYGKGYTKGNLKGITDLNAKPMGSGAYKLTKYKEGQEIDLVSNDSYWKGAPKVKNLIFKTTTEDTRIQELTTADVDLDMVTVNPENVTQIESAGFLNIQMFPTNGFGFIGMNVTNPMFSDPKVRQALTYGLERQKIENTVYKGYADVLNIPQSKVAWTYTDEGINKYEYNADKANKLLDEAGWKKGADGIREKDGKKFVIHFSASSPNPVNDAIIPVAKEDYAKLGIQFVPETMEFNAVLQKAEKNNVEMYFMAHGLVADPDVTILYGSKGLQNWGKYSNSKMDDLLAKALEEQDKTKRKADYAEIYKLYNSDLPEIPIYQRRDMWAIGSRVTNISATPYRDLFNDLWKAELK